MLKQSICKETLVKERAKQALIFLLLSIFLLSACPLKRSINLFLFQNAGIENTGLNYNKTGTAKGNYVAASKICTGSGQPWLANYNLTSSKFTFPSFPPSTGPFFLLPDISLKTHLAKGTSYNSSKALFALGGMHIYIINRRLLI
jgi:hypothetical protein